MTDQEFSQFARQLFVQYPSLYEWLHRNSPDPAATQGVWREQLRSYSAVECANVLAGWQAANDVPFQAYERDKVAMVVRATVDKSRDADRKRIEQDERSSEYRSARRNRSLDACGLTPTLTGSMETARQEGAPVHRRFWAGELTRIEYKTQLAEILARHGL